jgi:hypothetical protein
MADCARYQVEFVAHCESPKPEQRASAILHSTRSSLAPEKEAPLKAFLKDKKNWCNRELVDKQFGKTGSGLTWVEFDVIVGCEGTSRYACTSQSLYLHLVK